MNSSSEAFFVPPPESPAQAGGSAQAAGGDAPESRLEQALADLETLATDLEGQPEALLSLLRRLEKLHRTIQDGPFRASLPADRGALFQVLSEMERSGGWPYIPRLQLRTFLDLLGAEVGNEAVPEREGLPETAGSGNDSSPLAA